MAKYATTEELYKCDQCKIFLVEREFVECNKHLFCPNPKCGVKLFSYIESEGTYFRMYQLKGIKGRIQQGVSPEIING